MRCYPRTRYAIHGRAAIVKAQTQNCASCRYCEDIVKEIGDEAYVCRRYPPSLFDLHGKVHTLYPMINDIQKWWCGEHQAKFSSGAN